MAADTTLAELETLLGHLGLETPVPQLDAANVLAKPVDIYRAYLASLVATALRADQACCLRGHPVDR